MVSQYYQGVPPPLGPSLTTPPYPRGEPVLSGSSTTFGSKSYYHTHVVNRNYRGVLPPLGPSLTTPPYPRAEPVLSGSSTTFRSQSYYPHIHVVDQFYRGVPPPLGPSLTTPPYPRGAQASCVSVFDSLFVVAPIACVYCVRSLFCCTV